MRHTRGLRPCKAQTCPRVVAGKRCVAYNPSGELCVCQVHSDLLDHGRIWLDQNSRHVLTGEPYSASGEDVAALVADMAALGLHVTLTGRSAWYPGYTFLVYITRPDTPTPTC